MVKKNVNILKDMAAKDEVLRLAKNDLIMFGRIFLPRDFLYKESSPEFHHVIGDRLINNKYNARICNILPRGHAKSTLMKAAVLHRLYFGEENDPEFIAWVAEEQGQAIDNLKYIQNHIEDNRDLKHYFGDMDGRRRGNRWTEKDFITVKGDRVLAKGTAQKLRGKTSGDKRYTLIILDDFESELNTKTADGRMANKKWLSAVVFPALERTRKKEGSLWLAGTIVHYDSYLQGLVDAYEDSKRDGRDFSWDMNVYKATNDGTLSGQPIWPQRFPTSFLEEEYKRFVESNTANMFAQEYMNDARDRDSANFNVDNINYHTYQFESRNGFTYIRDDKEVIPVFIYIGVDIAGKSNDDSANQAVVVLGVDSDKNRYILDIFRGKIPAYDLPQIVLDFSIKYAPVKRVNFEDVAQQEIIRDMSERMSKQERRLMPGLMRGVKPPRGIKKDDRLVMALGSIVASKKVYVKREHSDLIEEMDQHPKSKYKDLMDAFYYANYYAQKRIPKSNRFSASDMPAEENEQKPEEFKQIPRYNFVTGLKVT